MVFIDDSAKIVCRFRVWTLQPLEYVPKKYLIDTIANILYQEPRKKAINFTRGKINQECSLDTDFQVL